MKMNFFYFYVSFLFFILATFLFFLFILMRHIYNM